VDSIAYLGTVIELFSGCATEMQGEANKVVELLAPFERWDRRANESPEKALLFADRRKKSVMDAAREAWGGSDDSPDDDIILFDDNTDTIWTDSNAA
jgi:hypothetical protein